MSKVKSSLFRNAQYEKRGSLPEAGKAHSHDNHHHHIIMLVIRKQKGGGWTCICIALRFGRKPLLVFSGSAMTICLGVLGYYYKMMEDGQNVESVSWLPLTCIGMFNVVFSLGYGSVPYSIISELFPPETKGIAGSISIMTNWFLVFFVTRTFHVLTHILHESVTFWLFASVCAMSALFAFVYVPETKGKTLQEIQTKLARRKKREREPAGEPKPMPIAPA